MQSFSWRGSCPDGPPAKIPRLAVGVNRLYVSLNERNFPKSLYLNEAALARDRLRKDSTVLELYRNKLVAEVLKIIFLQTLPALGWYRHQLPHTYFGETLRQRTGPVNTKDWG
jgi:hypothetical protein